MPVYTYECGKCEQSVDFSNTIDQRRTHAPVCNGCNEQMHIVISACMGVVRFPAAGGQEYISPTSGKPITTHRARIDDLKRSGCRPYEGFGSESRQAARVRAYEEKKADQKLHDNVATAYHQMSPANRRILDAA